MNFLTLIFSLLLILSFGTWTLLEKKVGAQKIRSTFLGHSVAHRKILSECEKETYKGLRSIPDSSPKTSSPKQKRRQEPPEEEKDRVIVNPECARLNLWPLIQDGKEKEPVLYETMARLLRTFYTASLFENQSGLEYRFLDLFLKRIKEELQKEGPFVFEKLSLNDPYLQSLYYKMLKGTKKKNLAVQNGYPSLLDSIRIEKIPAKICLFHANVDQLAVFFGYKSADKLYQEIHRAKSPPLTRELIENICFESHAPIFHPQIFEWFAFGRPKHNRSSKKTFVEEDKDTHISLRKNVYLPRAS